MKKQYFKVLFLAFCSNFIQAQCSPIIANNISVGCAPLEVIFVCTNYNTGTAVWTVNNTSTPGLVASIIFPNPGAFTVALTLTVTTSTGSCTGTATTLVTVVTGSAYGCATTVTDVKEYFDEKNLSVYPNPNTGTFDIQLDNDIENTKVILFDALGQNVHEEKLIKGVNTFNCSSLGKGIYFLNLFQNENRVSIKKVVIE